MASVVTRTYLSPTLVFIAMDWAEAQSQKDFLGFAIKRTPGFWGQAVSWLPNRITFNGPVPNAGDVPSDQAPIQKFMWWDARFDLAQDPNRQFTYEITPVTGKSTSPQLVSAARTTIHVTLPDHVEHGTGTWFNRAVLSSQAFSKKLTEMGISSTKKPTAQQALELRAWLANGLETVVPGFLNTTDDIYGAIYHLTDDLWIIPALTQYAQAGNADLVYDAKADPNPNDGVVEALQNKVTFHPRDKTNIMHDKFLVSGTKLGSTKAEPKRVLCGSANFTTGGLSSQANLLHTFDSPGLAKQYLDRQLLLQDNPTKAVTAKQGTEWSYTETVGDAAVRVFYSPEPTARRESIDTIVAAIHQAKESVLFCLFTPTDAPLRDACFAVGDNGKMMFGLVNRISDKSDSEAGDNVRADEAAAIELYHRSRENRDVVGADYYRWDKVPAGYLKEWQLFPGEKPQKYPPVIIHHKFIVIDAEGNEPIIYTGSANMSKNSVNHNDENLLEIRGSKRLAGIYLAEFFRLYEHYRARAAWQASLAGTMPTYRLAPDSSWAKKHFTPGTPEFRARVAMANLT